MVFHLNWWMVLASFLAWIIVVDGQHLIDCYPESGSASQSDCEARQCIWQENPIQDAPNCTFPDGYGYDVNGPETLTTLGYQLPLLRKPGQVSLYGGDIDNIRLTVEFWSENILRIKFDDPANQRYEVPITIYNKPEDQPNETNYSVSYNSTPEFGIYIIRESTGSIVFDTRVTGFIFADQFLQVTTLLPSANVYGFGEHRHGTFLHDMNYVEWAMFARDKAPSSIHQKGSNLYGVHPFYLNIENDGNANGVFLFNSNAMEVALHPDPSITYRTIGGVLDFYIFLGPTPEDVARQYHSLIGFPPLPSYWYLGYTLSRYGYTSTDEIRNLTESMIENELPYDVQVTDIDAFDAYLDFTVNPNGFSDLAAWTDELHAQGIRYLPIVDCAIGNERVGSYKALDDGLVLDIFVKNPNGTNLEGNVWPGNSYFPDFSHPDASSYWSDQFLYYHNIIGVHYDGAWIDMNEPSNFVDGSTSSCNNGNYDRPPYPTHVYGHEFGLYQKTICMESQQVFGMHYNVHSLYGHSEAKATYAALQSVFPGKRPNILSRSTYPGSNNYTTHWLGDNNSDYGALHDSIPGILEFNLFGIPVVGADICGFGGSASLELCIRWTQVGAFYTFTRNHNTYGSPPQDPISLGEEMINATKLAMTERYRLLPYLYTLLHTVHVKGGTVIRSLVHEFPHDANTRSISDQFMWGSALYISPVLDEGANTVSIYFPVTRWFNYYIGTEVTTFGTTGVIMPAFLDGPIPLHIRGGYIIPIQEPAVTTDLSRQNPFGLIVALDWNGTAEGIFFWDDGETENTDSLGIYNEFSFSHSGDTLTISVVHNGYNAQTQPLDTIKFFGLSGQPASVTVDGNAFTSGVNYGPIANVLTLTDLNLSYLVDHSIVLGMQ